MLKYLFFQLLLLAVALQCSAQDLGTCLRSISGASVVTPEDSTYVDASHCHNSGRSDRTWSPKAIIKVNSAEKVSEAVKCANLSDVTVTPRSGAHGFENEACSGELIVDVSNLDSLSVDTNSKVVEFGAGHLHGQLYRKLIDYGLVVPGGTENSVGTAGTSEKTSFHSLDLYPNFIMSARYTGLWLGCGRGPLAQLHGLSCDSMLGIEFVDASGNIRVANSGSDTDMYWMARGSGGEFPGVVTKFIAQAYDMPSEVFEVRTTFRADQVKMLIKEWVSRLEELSDPSHSMFTYINSYLGAPVLVMDCYSCTEEQKAWMLAEFEEIASIAGGEGENSYWGGTWLDRLLKEEWDDYTDANDLLLQQAEWPAVWETMANGGHMVPSFDASDEVLSVIQNLLESNDGNENFFLYIYSMTGPDITSVPLTQTAYGGREAKYVVHYKFFGSTTDAVKTPLRDVAVALDQAGLPCKGFYNYADREFPCAASSGDAWLEAHFSDVSRMRSIKQYEDRNNRFVSELKAKVWGFTTQGDADPQTGSPTMSPTAFPVNQTVTTTAAPPVDQLAVTTTTAAPPVNQPTDTTTTMATEAPTVSTAAGTPMATGAPMTCTAITDGSFGSAGKEALLLLNEETDCLVPGTGWHDYPHQDARIEPSSAEMCVSLDNSTRYIFSNGLPDHPIFSPSYRPKHCMVPFAAAMPRTPVYDGSYLEENPVAGPIGFALNGVPFVDAAWAVDNGFLFEESAWTGHANTLEFWWHYHSSRMPPSGEYAEEDELVGYAMDGFPIYGPTNNVLDECNGRLVDGSYRYHQVRMEDIDFSSPQCNANDPRIHNWNPIIGCFRGNTSQSRVYIDDGNRQGMICSSSSSTTGTPPSPSSTTDTATSPPATPFSPTMQPTSSLYIGGGSSLEGSPLAESSSGTTRRVRKLFGMLVIPVVLQTMLG